jgi:hypothetical protein
MKKLVLAGMVSLALVSGIMMLGACDLFEKDEKSCDDQNNCSAANNQYYCGKNGCAANYGNRCNCD